jgi:hypothetical protein
MGMKMYPIVVNMDTAPTSFSPLNDLTKQ